MRGNKMLRLVIRESGIERGVEFDLDKITIGRARANAVAVSERKASRKHCTIKKTSHGWFVIDLASRNGTKLNGKEIHRAPLAPGDVVSIGETEIHFEKVLKDTPPKHKARGQQEKVKKKKSGKWYSVRTSVAAAAAGFAAVLVVTTLLHTALSGKTQEEPASLTDTAEHAASQTIPGKPNSPDEPKREDTSQLLPPVQPAAPESPAQRSAAGHVDTPEAQQTPQPTAREQELIEKARNFLEKGDLRAAEDICKALLMTSESKEVLRKTGDILSAILSARHANDKGRERAGEPVTGKAQQKPAEQPKHPETEQPAKPRGVPDTTPGQARKQQPATPRPQPPKPVGDNKDDETRRARKESPFQKEINKAVEKGVNWLLKQQNKNGSFKGPWSVTYPMGQTALCLLALLKSGVNRNHPAVNKGFNYVGKLSPKKVYCVSLMLMALEAYYTPAEKGRGKANKSSAGPPERASAKRMDAATRKRVSCLAGWLAGGQRMGIWSYGDSDHAPLRGDLSNTQFAVLGLNAALRMKFKVPHRVFKNAADYLLKYQGEAKEKFEPPFRVPAADFSLEQLRRLQKDYYKRLSDKASTAKDSKRSRKQAKATPKTQPVEEDPYRRLGVEDKKLKMYPRGWRYIQVANKRQANLSCTGSMTAAGLACQIICKSGLHGTKYWTRRHAKQVNQSIRDGAAWLAKHFTVRYNPSGGPDTDGGGQLYYYLYGLERAGVLALVKNFGPHDWYEKGARFLIRRQKHDGSWPGSHQVPNQDTDPANTCFALLFLKRATTPIVSIPEKEGESIYTGEDLFKKKERDVPGDRQQDNPQGRRAEKGLRHDGPIGRAIDKGVDWLLRHQNKDGSFKGAYSDSYPMGQTALCLLALLKSGIDKNHPAIKKGFNYVLDLPLRRVYSVSILIMAIEAYCQDAPNPETPEGIKTSPSGAGTDLAKACLSDAVRWLISAQRDCLWSYFRTGTEKIGDMSNTQYALLGLNAGLRMKIKIPARTFKKVADYLLKYQGKKAPQLKPPFRVPAADFSMSQLRKLEKEYLKSAAGDPPSPAGATRPPENPAIDPKTTLDKDPYRRLGVEDKKLKMYPRGWGYTPSRLRSHIYASMTAAGVSSLIICKAGLTGSRYWTTKYARLANQAIRDGAAWLTVHFHDDVSVTAANGWGFYYYIYGIERAGVLALVKKFGPYDWYSEGSEILLEEQRPQGCWTDPQPPNRGRAAGCNPVVNSVDTCFALLFLSRATKPIVSGGEIIYTGEDLFKKKQKKAGEQENPGQNK